jgi:hypothetical protein
MVPRTLALWLATLLIVANVRVATAQIEAEEVRTAIDRAVEYLKKQQNKNGSWTDHAGQAGGATALCTLALLNAGVPATDDTVVRALSHLRGIKPTMTYAASLQIMAFAAAEPKKDLLLIRRNAKWLEDNQVQNGPRAGAWSYPSSGGGDNSNTQFALLALHDAERVGVTVSPRTWKRALDYWTKSQNQDGSWGYMPGMPGTGSMTGAGIASVIIADGALSKGDAEFTGGRVKCCGEQKPNEAIDKAVEWMGRNFSVHRNPGAAGGGWTYYYLYGLERVGRMSARRYLGSHDWYREGTEKLIRDQDRFSGFFKGAGHGESNPHVGTSLALLFLAKGRRPILVAKLKHGPLDDWNRHRSDLQNLTMFVEKEWERDLSWQVIDPKAATVEDLLQSPVLFISGKYAPQFTDEQQKKLRDYVDRGGFIFAEACCEGTAFAEGFRKLMRTCFPEEEYQLRLLPPEHPIWHAEKPVDPKYVRPLYGIDIGCRTSVVLCEGDISCYWELARSGRETNYPPELQKEIAATQAIGINVMAYATNRELKYKYDTFDLAAESKLVDNFDRGKLYVAKLKHPGGCNAAPLALGNLLQLAAEKKGLRVSTQPREAAPTDTSLYSYYLAFMHGRHNFRFTESERQLLRKYLENGGMLFADAICSSKEFDAAFRRELLAIMPEASLERIPATHPLFTAEFGGDDIARVSIRQPQRGDGPLKSLNRAGEPYLEGIKIGDRYAVIYSRYDLSCALEKHESLECEGYTRGDAARIGLNVLMYSLHQ